MFSLIYWPHFHASLYVQKIYCLKRKSETLNNVIFHQRIHPFPLLGKLSEEVIMWIQWRSKLSGGQVDVLVTFNTPPFQSCLGAWPSWVFYTNLLDLPFFIYESLWKICYCLWIFFFFELSTLAAHAHSPTLSSGKCLDGKNYHAFKSGDLLLARLCLLSTTRI